MVRAKTILPLLAIAALTCTLTREAHAQREILTPLGGKGTLAIDQLSGFRISSLGGVSYAGPIGFAVQSQGENGTGGAQVTNHYTTFWIAPSADYFVIDHLSIGGILEIMSTSISQDIRPNANAGTTTVSLPGTTNISFIPRVGWMFGITDRFGIWPRLGLGYASRQTAVNGDNKDTLSGFLIDLDVGFIYRITENFFLRAAPQLTFGLGPTHSTTVGTTTFSNDASFFQFAGVAGLGVMWDL
jgi:hypothetical protein